jgi:UDP-N-acetylglucosamine--N-acetylmuramyl-(pentapeptide) pyrophosphoryl-undecaprenol N-acetylglucosamine transferase
MKGSVVITGGGTGGHLKVADAFIEEYYKMGIKVIFIGSKNGQDKAWFEHDRRLKKAIFLDTRGVVNKNFLGKITSLLNIFSKTKYCLNFYSKHDVKTVISVGGFSAAAATFAGILKFGCKLYIHEQNSRMGKLNKLTAKYADELFSSYDRNSIIKDYPVSEDFFELARVRTKVKTVAFFGGSQGALFVNNYALKVAPKLNKMGIKIIHQTGKNDFDRVKKEYDKLGLEVEVFDFAKDISTRMSKADFAVSRAGASTLWELCANSLPTLFIPYPYAASDHQYHNAKFIEKKGMCFISREKNLKEDTLFDAINTDINKISKNLVSSINPHAVELMVKIIAQKNK